MAINTHFGGAPLNRPDVFNWQGPSGKTIMAYNGWTYDTGWRYGIGRSHDEFENNWWPWCCSGWTKSTISCRW